METNSTMKNSPNMKMLLGSTLGSSSRNSIDFLATKRKNTKDTSLRKKSSNS